MYGVCPKCDTEFEPPENPDPAGYFCPVCRKKGCKLIGIVHFDLIKPFPKEVTTA